MKKIALAVATVLFNATAHAELPAQYDNDKQAAIAAFNGHLKQQCVKDFLQKNHVASVSPLGTLSYNEAMSRAVYQAFYWDHADRGVAFSVPVKMELAGRERVRNLACFYAVTDKGLQFQLSQSVFGAFIKNGESQGF